MNVNTELGRLATFEPLHTSIPAATLVSLGFYLDRRTMCQRCSGCECSLRENINAQYQPHSSNCRWRNSLSNLYGSTIENGPACPSLFDKVNSATHIPPETEADNLSLQDTQISYTYRHFEYDSTPLHRKCSLMYFISNDERTGPPNTFSRERHLANLRAVKYERGHIRNDHDLLCLNYHVANVRWNSYIPLWQNLRLGAQNSIELQHLCFMLARVGFFLLRELTGGNNSIQVRYKLKLACSFCKRIDLLDVSFENSVEEILAKFLQRHRIATITCPISLNLQGNGNL